MRYADHLGWRRIGLGEVKEAFLELLAAEQLARGPGVDTWDVIRRLYRE